MSDKEQKLTGYPSIDKPWLKYYSTEQIEAASDIPPNMTMWDVLEKELQNDPTFPALEYFGRQITRAEFVELVYRWAGVFKMLGVQEDEVVPVYGPNFPDMCAIVCALDMLGAASYFLKLEISPEALAQECSDSKVAVVYEDMWGNVRSYINAEHFKKVIFIRTSDYMPLPLKLAIGAKRLFAESKAPRDNKYIYAADILKIAAKQAITNIKAPFKKERVAFITSSSGTTSNGIVKGTMATNEAAISQVIQAKHAGVEFPVGGKCLTNLPFTAATAINCLFFWPLYMKVTVIVDPRVSEDTFCEQLLKYRPQVTVMTGCWWANYFRHIETELNKGKPVDLSFFTMPIIGGEGSSRAEVVWMNNILKKSGSSVVIFAGFGLSELFSSITVDKLNRDTSIVRNKQVASVGIPYPCVTVGVFDENGKELPYDTRGELHIKSPSVMKGYYKKDALTRQTICDGWVCTGDLAEISPDGELYVWGRLSDSITVGNKLIYLFDVSIEMEQSPDVKQAMVLELPGEGRPSLVAHIVLSNSGKAADAVISALDAAMSEYLPEGVEIAGYKIHEIALPSSPTTAKKDRKKLIECTEYVKPSDTGLRKVSFHA